MASSIQPRRDDLDGLDDATAQMIIALQLEDLAEEERTAEASEATSQQTESAGTAHSLYRQTLEECQTNIKDRQLARSMMTAVLADASMIGSLVAEESRAREDRAMALEMAGQSNTVTLPAALPPLQEHPGELLSRMANRYVHPAVGRALMPNDVLERETQRGGNEGGANARTYRCSSCLDDKSYFEVLTAPCNHIYCETCLRDLFSRSLTDESLFPPRCCRLPIPIDLTGIEFFLPGDLRSAYETRRIETSTQDRTYCSNTSCGKFVLPSRMAGNRASCPACLTVTCVACKRGYHTGACVRDEAHEQALELAARQGWRRCSGCQNMVELNTGCNHMSEFSVADQLFNIKPWLTRHSLHMRS